MILAKRCEFDDDSEKEGRSNSVEKIEEEKISLLKLVLIAFQDLILDVF